jgi:hypothetical protein
MRIQVALYIAALSSSLFVVGCDDDHDHDGHDPGTEESHSADEEACEHMTQGPFEDVTATAMSTGAPSAAYEHTAVRITLTPDPVDETQYVGYVTYEADDETEFVFFLSADVPFAILDASGSEVEIEESEAVSTCDEVAMEHVADLSVGSYTLLLGPTSETQVSLVAEEASHEGDAPHDDH